LTGEDTVRGDILDIAPYSRIKIGKSESEIQKMNQEVELWTQL